MLGTTPDFDPLPPLHRARRPRPLFEGVQVVEARSRKMQRAA
jgi:hypothetical protein